MRVSVKLGALVALAAISVGCSGEDDSLSIYTHNDEDEMQGFVEAAEEATDLDIEFLRMSSGEALSRVQAEAPDIGADMMWGMTHSGALELENDGLLTSYDSPEWDDIDDEFVSDDGTWYGWSYWFNIIGVNTDLMDELDLDTPQSWDDLLDEQYEGEIVMPDPRESGTAYLVLASLIQIMGEDEAWEYLEQLDENVGEYDQSGTAPAEKVARGEYAVGITWDQAVFDRIDEGFPMEYVIPEEGVGFDLDVAFIFEDAENPEAAQRLIDWLGTEEGMETAATERALVTRQDIEGTIDFEPNF
ncbi:MAG: ABC transporter substrate-binding protein, partial [Nitriliruptoraceae bacterium]